jgi:hypothetical protein
MCIKSSLLILYMVQKPHAIADSNLGLPVMNEYSPKHYFWVNILRMLRC